VQTELSLLVSQLPAGSVAQATRLGLVLAPSIGSDAWNHVVVHVARLANGASSHRHTTTAWLGDVLASGYNRGRGYISQCAAAAGLDPGTLRNAKLVCSRIPVSCRHDRLTWSHHCEVGLAFTDPRTIEEWLSSAERESLSTAELRRRIRNHQASVVTEALSTAPYSVLRELRAACRIVERERHLWRQWPPGAAKAALAEIEPLVALINSLRSRALLARRETPDEPSLN
jgi:hypothetical protein